MLILALQHREHYWRYQTVRHRVAYKAVVISPLRNSGPKPQKDLLGQIYSTAEHPYGALPSIARTTTTTTPNRATPTLSVRGSETTGSCEASHPVPLRSGPRPAPPLHQPRPRRERRPRPGSPGAPAPPRVLLAAAAASPRRRARRAFLLFVFLLRGHADLHWAAARRELRAGSPGLLRPALPLRHGAPLLPRWRSTRARRGSRRSLPAALPPAPRTAAARPPLLLLLAAGGSAPPGGARPGMCGPALSRGGASAG